MVNIFSTFIGGLFLHIHPTKGNFDGTNQLSWSSWTPSHSLFFFFPSFPLLIFFYISFFLLLFLFPPSLFLFILCTRIPLQKYVILKTYYTRMQCGVKTAVRPHNHDAISKQAITRRANTSGFTQSGNVRLCPHSKKVFSIISRPLKEGHRLFIYL